MAPDRERGNWHESATLLPVSTRLMRCLSIHNPKVKTMAYQSVGLNVTSHCNHRCVFCFQGHAERPSHKPYPLLLEQLARAAEQAPGCSLVLSGGEATLHPDITRLIRAAANHGFCYITLFTNGSGFHDRSVVRELKESGLEHAMVSLHGLRPETHNLLVGRESWHAAVEGVATALQQGILITVNTVATSVNLQELAPLHAFLDERFPALTAHRLSYLACIGQMRWRDDLLAPYQDVAGIVRRLAAKPRRIPLQCDLVPLCLLAEDFRVGVETNARRGEYLIIDKRPNDCWRGVSGRPCLVCTWRHHCNGLQVAPVLRYGVPLGYGSCCDTPEAMAVSKCDNSDRTGRL